MKKLLILILFSILGFNTGVLHAFGRRFVGTTSAQFLKLGVNARAIAMGEAYSCVSDGSDSIYWNPAGLDKVEKHSLSLMHAVYLQEIFYDFASYAKRFGKIGALGLSIQYLNAGSIDQTDEFGTNVGTFQPSHTALSIGWAMKLLEFEFLEEKNEFSLGVSAKLIQSRIIETAYAGALDLGMLWSPVEKCWLGIAAQNIGPSFKFKNELDHLPLNFKIGSSYQVSNPFLLALDVNFPRDNDPNMGFGMEYKKKLSQDFSMAGRTGFNTKTTPDISGLSTISAGLGFNFKNNEIDFAWVPFGDLGHTYRISYAKKF